MKEVKSNLLYNVLLLVFVALFLRTENTAGHDSAAALDSTLQNRPRRFDDPFRKFNEASTIQWTRLPKSELGQKWPVLDPDEKFQIYPGIYPGLTLQEVRSRLGGSDLHTDIRPRFDLQGKSEQYEVTYFAFGALSVITEDGMVKAVLGSVLLNGNTRSFSSGDAMTYPLERLDSPHLATAEFLAFSETQTEIYVYPLPSHSDRIGQVLIAEKGFDPLKSGFVFKELELDWEAMDPNRCPDPGAQNAPLEKGEATAKTN